MTFDFGFVGNYVLGFDFSQDLLDSLKSPTFEITYQCRIKVVLHKDTTSNATMQFGWSSSLGVCVAFFSRA
jgi:hypothetical protein